MRVLTDTHTLVWALSDPDSLSATARKVLMESDVAASVANLWELVLKTGKKDALLDDPIAWWNKYVARSGIRTLSIQTAHVLTMGRLAGIHKDPFDRILVAQSLSEKLPLVSKHKLLERYGVEVIW
ncbi:MAG: type II toxin-antitoxin system VapC family toxin [Bryobacteraceae bacterium]